LQIKLPTELTGEKNLKIVLDTTKLQLCSVSFFVNFFYVNTVL